MNSARDESSVAAYPKPPTDLRNFPAGATQEQYHGEWEAPCGCSWKRTEEGGRRHAKCGEHWLD